MAGWQDNSQRRRIKGMSIVVVQLMTAPFCTDEDNVRSLLHVKVLFVFVLQDIRDIQGYIVCVCVNVCVCTPDVLKLQFDIPGPEKVLGVDVTNVVIFS